MSSRRAAEAQRYALLQFSKVMIMIKLSSLVFLLFIFGFGDDRCIVSQPSQTEVSSAEYAVYSAVLEQGYRSDEITLFVIEDHTDNSSSNYGDDAPANFRYVKKHLRSLSRVAINDFRRKNRQSVPLSSSFNLKEKYTLIPRLKFEGFAGPGGMGMEMSQVGWEKFYGEYPRSLGLLSLSRVGFDPKKNQALVYVSDMRGNPSGRAWGAGSYLLLIKKAGIWHVRGHVALVVS